MVNTIITYLQIFGIGLTFGIAGPCFLVCTPILITYIAGSEKKLRGAFIDIAIFSLGRLLAYVLLGCIAGLSVALLKKITSQDLSVFFKPLGGLVSIILGVIVLLNKNRDGRTCPAGHKDIYGAGGLFVLGFMIGISPCAPLIALLLEITLISNTALEGSLYALSFGLGTSLAGIIVVGALAGFVAWLPPKVLKSEKGSRIFRIICAVLLILFGAYLMMKI